MKITHALPALVVTMTVLLTAEANVHAQSDVTVRSMSPQLKLTGQVVTWSVPGEILPPLVTAPGGEVLIIVKNPDGRLELQRRDQLGKELARVPLAASGRFLAARLFGEGLLIAIEGQIALFDRKTLQQKEHATLGTSATEGGFVVGPRGLWSLGTTQLTYSDLSGATWSRLFPLVPWHVPFCPAPGACMGQTQGRWADVTDAGALLLTEVALEELPIKGGHQQTDGVSISRGIWLDTGGNVLASQMLSGVESYGQWFWSETGSASPLGFGREYGLYRTRYRKNGPTGTAIAGGSSVVIVRHLNKEDSRLTAIDATSREVWKQRVNAGTATTFSPRWTTPTLLHDNDCTRFTALDVNGKIITESEIDVIVEINEMREKTRLQLPHFAIGQATDGTWLLVAYAPRLPP